MYPGVVTVDLSPAQFDRISRLVHRLCGISLRGGKEALVRARLLKRLQALGMTSYDQYLRYVEDDRSGQEVMALVDAVTTNKTAFFREPQHFDYLRHVLIPVWSRTRDRIRIWSAGCSSGEEAFSIAIVLCEELPDVEARDVSILATDISTTMLARARAATFDAEAVRAVGSERLARYFTRRWRGAAEVYQVSEQVGRLVRFARLNLLDDWPMRGPFDAIFCRNVMIYFDQPTRERLVQRLWRIVRPDGHLFIGHSESLTGIAQPFRYVQPSVYVRTDAVAGLRHPPEAGRPPARS